MPSCVFLQKEGKLQKIKGQNFKIGNNTFKKGNNTLKIGNDTSIFGEKFKLGTKLFNWELTKNLKLGIKLQNLEQRNF